MMRRFLYLLPIVIFSFLVGFFALRLILIERGDTPDKIPSALIGKPAPFFDLPSLFADKPNLKTADLKGHVSVINFFASWCVPCQSEHPYLASLAGHNAVIVGIDYKNKPDEARAWLRKMSNPFDTVAMDADGKTAIDFGLYGVPETFLVDKKGIIRFKQIGPLTPEVIRDKLLPLIAELNE